MIRSLSNHFLTLGFYLILLVLLAWKQIEYSLFSQVKLAFFLSTTLYLGCFFLNRFKHNFKDSIFYYAGCFICGLCGYFLVGFVIFHRFIIDTLQLPPAQIGNFVVLLASPFFLIGFFKDIKSKEVLPVNVNLGLRVLAVSFVVWCIGYAGFKSFPYHLERENLPSNLTYKFSEQLSDYYLETKPGSYRITDQSVTNGSKSDSKNLLISLHSLRDEVFWGNPVDKYVHINFQVHELNYSLLPLKHPGHRAMQIFALSAVKFLSGSNDHEYIYYQASKAMILLLLPIWFIFIYSFVFLARFCFRLPEKHTNIVMFSAPFFEVIMLPFNAGSWGIFKRFFSVSEALYFNIGHLYSVTISMVAIGILLLSQKGDKRLVVITSIYVALSLLFKPSAFMVIAPALFFYVFADLYKRRIFEPSYFVALAILLAVTLFFFAYQDFAISADTILSSPTIKPFFLLNYASSNFIPDILKTSLISQSLYVFLLGFAAFLPRLVQYLYSNKGVSISLPALLDYFADRKTDWFFYSMLITGIFSALFLIEDNYRIFHFNFSWPFGASYILCLPLFLSKILSSSGMVYKLSYMLICLHILFGLGSMIGMLFFT